MPITVSVLGSGSRGNATFIKSDQVRLLVDAGLSRKELAKRLESIGKIRTVLTPFSSPTNTGITHADSKPY